jgi:hypothetical protein
MSASISLLGQPLAIRSSVCVSQASGSTLFIFAACSSLPMVAQLLSPPSLPSKSEFFLVMAWGLIARSTMLEPSSMRPSARKRAKMARREIA